MRVRSWMPLLLLCLAACGDGGDENCATIVSENVPSEKNALFDYLKCNMYTAFASERAAHPTASAHGSMARVFINAALDDSLRAQSTSHPVGAAAVKELYEADGSSLRGWSVMVKVDSAAGDGNDWYWLENFSTTNVDSPIGNAKGAGVCVGCHSAGVDSFLTAYPLQ